MHASDQGHGPGLAAPDAASSGSAAGAASMVADAVAPAGLTVQKASTPAALAAQSQEQNEPQKSATGTGADKAFFTLQAVLALRGHVLSRTHGDNGPVRCFVSHWSMVRELLDLAAVERLLD